MNTKSKIIFTLAATSLFCIIAVVLYLYFIHNPQDGELTYSDVPILNSERATNPNVFINNPKSTVSRSIQKTFTDWQSSAEIKHAKYSPADSSTTPSSQQYSIPKVSQEQSTVITESKSNSWGSDIWEWIPKNIKRTNIRPEAEPPELVVIRSFGNAYGSTIKRFTATLGDQPKVMNSFMQGRGTEDNVTDMVSMGQKYIDITETLTNLQAPAGFESTALSLSNAYKAVGEATIDLSKSGDDTDTIERIYSYNTVVEDFAKSYLALVNLFGAYGVKFSKGEGGDIFMPPM